MLGKRFQEEGRNALLPACVVIVSPILLKSQTEEDQVTDTSFAVTGRKTDFGGGGGSRVVVILITLCISESTGEKNAIRFLTEVFSG